MNENPIYPNFKPEDIKVLGRVVSIASNNKVAAAEQVYDDKFNYNTIITDWNGTNDQNTATKLGLSQYEINRLLGWRMKKLEKAGLMPDENGWLDNVKIHNLTVDRSAIFSGDATFNGNVNINGILKLGDIDNVKTYINNLRTDVNNLTTKVNSIQGSDLEDLLDNYYTKQLIDQMLQNITSSINTILGDIDNINNKISQIEGNITRLLNNYYSKTEIDSKILWQRSGTTLSPKNAGDNVSTSGKIYSGN